MQINKIKNGHGIIILEKRAWGAVFSKKKKLGPTLLLNKKFEKYYIFQKI